jgi:hypothetical protein
MNCKADVAPFPLLMWGVVFHCLRLFLLFLSAFLGQTFGLEPNRRLTIAFCINQSFEFHPRKQTTHDLRAPPQVHVTDIAAVPLKLLPPAFHDVSHIPTHQPSAKPTEQCTQGGGEQEELRNNEGDRAVAASVLRGSLAGHAHHALAPAQINTLNVLALSQAPDLINVS